MMGVEHRASMMKQVMLAAEMGFRRPVRPTQKESRPHSIKVPNILHAFWP
jgi:hypothetical protein